MKKLSRSSCFLACGLAIAFAGTLGAASRSRQAQQGGGQGQAQGQGAGQQQGGQRGGGGQQGQTNQQRDPNATAQSVPTGTGVIAGSVSAADNGRPVRKAMVLITASNVAVSKSMLTGDDGRFSFADLPVGRYTLTASKSGFVDAIYGQKAPRRPGTPVQLADGQKLEKIDIRIPRGGVITGVLLDEHGDPSSRTEVRAMRSDMRTGEKQFVNAGSDSTDDRGVYRIFGLPPGDYIVNAVPAVDFYDLQQMVQDAVSSGAGGALNNGRGGRAGGPGGGGPGGQQNGPGGPGGGRGGPAQILSAMLSDDQPTGYAPVYFPGTTSSATAQVVQVQAGEEKGGIDFQLQIVPTAKIEGLVVGLDPSEMQGVSVQLINQQEQAAGLGFNSTGVGNDGKFTFTGVAPGQYMIEARGARRATTPDTATAQSAQGGGRGGRGGGGFGGPPMDVLWGELPIGVDGHNQKDLVVSLQSGMTISGHITFDDAGPSTQAAPTLTNVRVMLTAQGQGGQGGGPGGRGGGPGGAQVDATGRFTVTGLVPGKYRINVNGVNGWLPKTVVGAGRDALDFGIEVKGGQEIGSLIITMSNKSTQLGGTLQDAMGRPTSDYTIIVFPSDTQYWLPQSRRIQSTRPGTDGTYTVRGLPPGDYLMSAVTDVEPGAWFDPSFLETLKSSSTPIHLSEGEKKTQDLRLAGG